MAIVAVSLGSVGDTGAATIYGVALQRAPTANAVVLVTLNHSDTAPENIASGVSGAGMVFSLLTQRPFDTLASNVHRLEVWKGMSTSPTGSRISVNMGDAGTGCAILVTEFSGVSTSGTSGANAVKVSATTGVDTASRSTTFLASFTSAANGVFVASGVALNSTADAPNSQYLALDKAAFNTPATGLSSGWTSSSGVTTCVWTGAGSTNRAALAIELVADNPVAQVSDDVLIRFGPAADVLNGSGLQTSVFSATGGGGGAVFSPYYYNMMQEWFSS